MQTTIIAIKLAFKNLRSNVGRTVLSLLGIVIGVMAIVIVLSLGNGLQKFVSQQLESFGTDFIEIEIKIPNTEQASAQNAGSIAGGTQITTFKLEDAQEVAKLPNVSDWYAGNLGQEVVSFRGHNKQAMIMGTTEGITGVDSNFEIENGEMFSAEDDRGLKQVVLLGSKLKDDLFGSNRAVGEKVKIKKQSYTVIGVLKERGGGGFFDFDQLVYMPLETLQKKILGIDYITFGMFKVKDLTQMEITKLEMEDIMRDQHDIDDPDEDDFAVMSVAEAMDLLDDIFNTINILLISLTSISLIVGGVGITNVMYVAVTERTFEIGLRKAIGAHKKDILQQFMFEAIFITIAGGLLGIIIGFGLAKLAEYVFTQLGFILYFPLTAGGVLLGLGFSAVIGLIFGIRPAIKASRLSPMEALRKE